MNVVLYLRYSSDRQNEQSIEGQERVCRAFCSQHNYTVVGTYIDRALTATKNVEKRIEFQNMINDSSKGNFEAVIVYKLDRFARNRYDSATYKAKLKRNGVKVISATENISDNPEGIILESVLEGMAEFYSKELAQKITRGMYETARKGQSTGGQISLGYKIENKKLVLDPERAEWVKEAFQRYAQGETIAQICESFNARGYRTKTGSKFNKNSFHHIFNNDKYIGIYRFMDVVIEGGVPAIVSKELFQQVQQRTLATRKAPQRGRAKHEYILTGKLICGVCGDKMTGSTSTGRGGQYSYYNCPTQRVEHKCKKKPVRKDIIERMVCEATMELLTPEYLEKIADVCYSQIQKENKEKDYTANIKKEIADYEKSIANLLKVLEQGLDIESVSKRLKELEQNKKDAEKRLRQAEEELIPLTKELILYFLEQFTQGSIEDENYRKRIVDLLVNSVIVYEDDDPDHYRFLITWNLDGTKPKTIECACTASSTPPLKVYTHTYYMYSYNTLSREVKYRLK